MWVVMSCPDNIFYSLLLERMEHVAQTMNTLQLKALP